MLRRSRTSVRRPRCPASRAVLSPKIPPPTTTRSYSAPACSFTAGLLFAIRRGTTRCAGLGLRSSLVRPHPPSVGPLPSLPRRPPAFAQPHQDHRAALDVVGLAVP